MEVESIEKLGDNSVLALCEIRFLANDDDKTLNASVVITPNLGNASIESAGQKC